jgi:hypothetical protein
VPREYATAKAFRIAPEDRLNKTTKRTDPAPIISGAA